MAPLNPIEFLDLAAYLREELAERRKRNPKYSLRSFSHSLKMSHSSLSQIINGKRPFTLKMRQKIIQELGLGPQASAHLLASKLHAIPDFADLDADSFARICDWYHDAVLELVRLESFDPAPAWIAKALAIDKRQARAAIQRLVKAKLLVKNKDGRWENGIGDNTTHPESGTTNLAYRSFQKQILARASSAVDVIPPQFRDNSSVMALLNPEDVAEVKALIRKFRHRYIRFLKSKKVKKGEIYQLGICFYPHTNLEGVIK